MTSGESLPFLSLDLHICKVELMNPVLTPPGLVDKAQVRSIILLCFGNFRMLGKGRESIT